MRRGTHSRHAGFARRGTHSRHGEFARVMGADSDRDGIAHAVTAACSVNSRVRGGSLRAVNYIPPPGAVRGLFKRQQGWGRRRANA